MMRHPKCAAAAAKKSKNVEEVDGKSTEKPKKRFLKAKQALMYFDGGSRGNGTDHSEAGAGFEISCIANGCVYIGKATNNVAEYTGLEHGLGFARRLGLEHVRVRGDSLLVINQMQGKWKVNNPELRIIHDRIKEMIKTSFKSVVFEWVPRDENKKADSLANEAIDKKITKNTVFG